MPVADVIASFGGVDEYKDLVAAVAKSTDKDFLYYGSWALATYLRRTGIELDKGAAAKVDSVVAKNDKLDAMTRNSAFDTVEASGDKTFAAFAASLAKDKDASVAKHAAEGLERAKKLKDKKP